MITRGLQTGLKRGVIPSRHMVVIGLALLALFVGVLYMSLSVLQRALGPAQAAAAGGVSSRLASMPEQVNVGGDVTLRVTWEGPEAGPVFEVAMDTHSVDLDGYDLSRMAILHTDTGRQTVNLSWDAPAGGHHRKGKLVFSELAMDGKPFVAADTASIELVVYDLSGVPTRSFKWELK